MKEHIPIQQSRFSGSLMADHSIRLLTLRRRKVLRSWALGPTPVALSKEERTSYHPDISLPSSLVDDCLLSLNYAPYFALVIHANDLVAELKCLAGGGRRERLEEGNEALAIYNAARVEFGNAGDGS